MVAKAGHSQDQDQQPRLFIGAEPVGSNEKE